MSYILPSVILMASYGCIAFKLYRSARNLEFSQWLRDDTSSSLTPSTSSQNQSTQTHSNFTASRSLLSRASSRFSKDSTHSKSETSSVRNQRATKQRIHGVPVALSLAVAFVIGWLPFYLSLFDMHYRQGQMLGGYGKPSYAIITNIC